MRGWNIILLVAVVAAGCAPEDRSQYVTVIDRSVGCFHEDEVVTRYERRGRLYVSQNRSIPYRYIEAVREIVIGARCDRDAVLDQFNVTPQIVADHFLDMVEAARWMWPNQIPDNPDELPPGMRSVLEYGAIADEVLANSIGPVGGTTQVEFSVILPGSPPLRVTSKNEHPFMLPWTVQFGDATWETYSIEVPISLALLADGAGPNAGLLNGTDYWARRFWRDQSVWGMAVVGELP